MSLKKKLSIIFSLVVTLILIVNNTLYYFYTRDLLLKDQVKQMESLAKDISIGIEHSQFGTEYVENIVGEKLRTAAIAAQQTLDPDINNVSNEELVVLSEKLGVSYITLLVREKDDIRGVKSSDPKERDLSTKEWGYWYTAFEQLFANKNVTIPQGQKLPNYWAGPMNVSASDPNHVDKWGYYYDGTTNYIISPYMRDKQIMGFKDEIGPDVIIKETLKNNAYLLSIAGFNPNTFGRPPMYTEQNGQKFIELTNQAIQFGKYDYKDEALDVSAVRTAMKTGKVVSFQSESKGKKVIKSFIAVPATIPYVIGIVMDYKVVENVLNKQLFNNFMISVIILLLVLGISYMLADYIVRPVNRILQKVNEIAEGNIGAQMPITRKDELGALSSGVNTMSQNLLDYTNELKEKNKEIQYHAYYDLLTGLPNRRFFNKLASDVMIKDKKESTAFLFLDLDRFKLINDMFGHSVGDYILKAVTHRVSSLLGDGEIMSRIGGDEFVLLLPNSSCNAAAKRAEMILKTLENPFLYEGNELFITSSIGISLYPQDGEEMESLLKNADMAMYCAKEEGRNNYQFYTVDMDKSMQRRAFLEKGMRRALEQNEFTLHYQPKIDLQTGIVTANEALIRWFRSDIGTVSPLEFVPLAEETGLIVPIGEWILRTACEQNKAWQDAGMPPMRVSVNLSIRQFQQGNLVEVVANVLHDTGLNPKYLELEITESIAMYNEELVIAKLQALKKLGVEIAIDDFGTGYSSLSYLKKFPIHTLKIDKSFIEDIKDGTEDIKIITAIISLAHNLHLNVIAEGVETNEQLQFLKQQKCNEGQGYLFSKPLSAEEFTEVYKDIQEAAIRRIKNKKLVKEGDRI